MNIMYAFYSIDQIKIKLKSQAYMYMNLHISIFQTYKRTCI